MKIIVKIKNISILFYSTLLFLIACKEEKTCNHKGINEDFKVYNNLISTIIQKDRIKIYELADSNVVKTIFEITDSLNNPHKFGLIKECHKGVNFKYTSDSTFVVSVGKSEPILAFTGGLYGFIKRKDNHTFILSEIISLE